MKADKTKMQNQPELFKREFKDEGCTLIHHILPAVGQKDICEMRCGTRNGMTHTGTLEVDTESLDIEYSTVKFAKDVGLCPLGLLEWSRTISEYLKTIC